MREIDVEAGVSSLEGHKKGRAYQHARGETKNSCSEIVSPRKSSCTELSLESRGEALDALARVHSVEGARPGFSRLVTLNDEVLGMLWPAEGVVAGQLVCKKLNAVLVAARRVKFQVNPRSVRRFQQQNRGTSRSIVDKMALAMCRYPNAEIDFLYEDHQQAYYLHNRDDEDDGQPMPSKQARIALKALKKVALAGHKVREVGFCGVPENLLRELHNLGRQPGGERLPLHRVDLSNAGRMCKHATKSLNLLSCSTLSELKLSAVQFWPGPLRNLGHALGRCLSLRLLDMSDCTLPPLGKFPSSSLSFWGHVCGLSALEELDLSRVAFNGHELVLDRHIARLHSLRRFAFSRTDCSPFDMNNLAASLAHLRHLTHLGLAGNTLDARAMCSLATAAAQWPELQRLDLSGCELAATEESWEFLLGAVGSCPHLRDLDLSHSGTSSPAAPALASRVLSEQLQRWQSLTALDVRGRLALDDEVLSGALAGILGGCRELRRLSVSVPIRRLGAHCQRLSHLELAHLELGGAAGDAVLAEVRALTGLMVLKLRSCGLTDGERLAGLLPLLPRLSHLDLSRNALGPRGATSLAVGLARCSKLEALSLAEASLEDEGAVAVAAVLPALPRLTALNLRGNRLRPPGVLALCGSLPRQLSHLDLAGNAIWAAGYRALAEALPRHPLLTTAQLHASSTADDASQAAPDDVDEAHVEEVVAAQEGVQGALCAAARLRVLRVKEADAPGEECDWMPESSEDGMDEEDWDDVAANGQAAPLQPAW